MDKSSKAKNGVVYRTIFAVVVLIALLIVVSVVAVGIGAERVPAAASLKVIGSHIFGWKVPPSMSTFDTIIWDIRLPRVILAAIVGMLLSVSGVALQGLLRNPLADPYTVGVSSGAALGASIAVVLGIGALFHGFGVPVLAFAFACAAMLVVYSLARFSGRVSINSFLLAGIVVGSFLWAVLTFVMTLAGRDLATIIHWLLGSLDAPDPWTYVLMILPFAAIGMIAIYAMARDLNVISLGEETARNLGIETERLKLMVIAITSLVTSAAVSVSGIIGFVGLIVPHIMRRVVGADHRSLIPSAALTGAILMVVADLLARILGELPVGVITAMIGAPFFLYLLRSQAGRRL